MNVNFKPFPTVETDHYRLRKLKCTDREKIYEYQRDKRNFEYVEMPEYESMTEADQYIAKMNDGVSKNKWIIWGVADKHTDQILGTISLWNLSTEAKTGELGYGLFPENRGKGIMSVALNKVLEYGFKVMELSTIEAYTGVRNLPSIRLLEDANFIKTRTLMEKSPITKRTTEMVSYQIHKQNFMKNRKGV